MLQEPVLRIPHRNKYKPQCSTTHAHTLHHQTNHPAMIPKLYVATKLPKLYHVA
uniref:Uncharacterized protein n=1 Tax=Arundo donax TaxID=35708 RepID=A0A0A9G894_ARUDO